MKYLASILAFFTPSSKSADDLYLEQAANHVELENRLRELDRKNATSMLFFR